MEIEGLEAGYGNRVVVRGVTITIDEKEIVLLIGSNGAGKTTTIRTVFGFLKPSKGKVVYNGNPITARSPLANVKDRISYTPQERFIFPDLSVKDNLDMGAYTIEDGVESSLETIYRLFPILKERLWQRAGTLSGGEQRMLGIGMALITRPNLLLLDEPSVGLAPVLVQAVMSTLEHIKNDLGTSILLVEQNVKQALRIADRVYVMKMGEILLEESGESLLEKGQWWDLY